MAIEIPAYLKPFEALGARVVAIDDNHCTIEGPSGVKATIGIAEAKSAARELSILTSSSTAGVARFGNAKDALSARAKTFGQTLVGLTKNLGAPIVADMFAKNIGPSIENLIPTKEVG